MKFKNPANGYIEDSSAPWLWTLLFGGLYFAYKGVWRHLFISFILAILTGLVSWLFYPFFASEIIRKSYLRKGWIEVGRVNRFGTEATEPFKSTEFEKTTLKYAVYTFLVIFVLVITALI